MANFIGGVLGGVGSGTLLGFALGAQREREIIKQYTEGGILKKGVALIWYRTLMDEAENNLQKDVIVGVLTGSVFGFLTAALNEDSLRACCRMRGLPISTIFARSIGWTVAATLLTHSVLR